MTYDANGNLKSDGNCTYTYDAWNHIVSEFVNGLEYSGSTVYYPYNALGERVTQTIVPPPGFGNGSQTFSFYNSGDQVAEDDVYTIPGSGSGYLSNKYTYVWGVGGINDLVARDDSSGNRLYVQQDANDDVTALVGKVGSTWEVIERFVYTPYGQVSVLNASFSSTADSYHWVYLWQTGRYDYVSGLYYFRNRDYSPTLGRWMEKDPTGSDYIDGPNLYMFVGDAPQKFIDPSGEWLVGAIWGSVSGAIAGATSASASGAGTWGCIWSGLAGGVVGGVVGAVFPPPADGWAGAAAGGTVGGLVGNLVGQEVQNVVNDRPLGNVDVASAAGATAGGLVAGLIAPIAPEGSEFSDQVIFNATRAVITGLGKAIGAKAVKNLCPTTNSTTSAPTTRPVAPFPHLRPPYPPGGPFLPMPPSPFNDDPIFPAAPSSGSATTQPAPTTNPWTIRIGIDPRGGMHIISAPVPH